MLKLAFIRALKWETEYSYAFCSGELKFYATEACRTPLESQISYLSNGVRQWQIRGTVQILDASQVPKNMTLRHRKYRKSAVEFDPKL